MPRRGPSSRFRGLVLVLVVLALGLYLVGRRNDDGASSDDPPIPSAAARIFETNDGVDRGCGLDKEVLARVWRGYVPGRSFELILVPHYPNYPGSFDYTGHSGPWDYLQNIPLVFYGDRIEARGPIEAPASLADVYPTAGELLDADLPDRAGRTLSEAVKDDVDGVPRAIITVVWDGVGRNVLERWPDAWPNLKRLEEQGTSYVNASLGSSPSITPATHTTLGTGAFPREHGIPAIEMRKENGEVGSAFIDRDPKDVEVTTFADEYDLAMGNAPIVGMLGWKTWHLGMLGHGTQIEGADADQLGILGGKDGDITGNDAFYSTPPYLPGFLGLEEHARALDREDGEVDGEWMGHDVMGVHDNPAWVYWQEDALMEMLQQEGYGKDEVPDLFFTNYKMADIVGHEYTIVSEEMEVVVRAQDEALGRLIDYLDAEVGDYVVIVTADHGHTPPSEVSGGWPVSMGEVNKDMLAHFDVPEEESFTESATAAGFFFDHDKMDAAGVTGAEITEFMNDYTIAENWTEGELPEAFRDRGEEHVFEAAFMESQMADVMRCAFGSKKLPPDAPL